MRRWEYKEWRWMLGEMREGSGEGYLVLRVGGRSQSYHAHEHFEDAEQAVALEETIPD